jgi:hypothetical protein
MRNENLVLEALRREFRRLSKIADKAKQDADEVCNAGSEFIAINTTELAEALEQMKSGKDITSKLDELQARDKKARRLMKKPLTPLLDKQSKAEFERDQVGSEIQMLEWRISMVSGDL